MEYKEAIEKKIRELGEQLKSNVGLGQNLIAQRNMLDEKIRKFKSAAELIMAKMAGLNEVLKE